MDLVTQSLTLMAGTRQLALLQHLVEAMHAGGGLLGDAAISGRSPLYQPGLSLSSVLSEANRISSSSLVAASRNLVSPFSARSPRWISSVASPPSSTIRFGVPPSPHSKMRSRVVPVFLERLALEGEDRGAAGGDRRGRVVLRGEDVAARPAHLGAQRLQRLDQHGRLDRHVQRAGDARAFQRLLACRTSRARPSGRASRARRWRFPCGPNRPGRCPSPRSLCGLCEPSLARFPESC